MGPTALTFYRAAKRLQALPRLANMVATVGDRLHSSHVDTKAVLHPTVELGYGGIGVIIASGVEIGENSFISQNVSLEPLPGRVGVPRVGRDVYIGVGAQVLGPVVIGDGAKVGANAIVLDDVAPGTTVAGIPARELKQKVPPTGT
ncbi:acetyltransferase [Corallococcus sp. AB004]|uniref:serine O-acetyltransferase n=1 Tax=Corallococcus TaxID=83461 RepID=UPI000EA3709A|nr:MULTISPECIES: DapH/DapD/GlmU-related protein [Corallococcus]RKI42201.1 acetyltransferase [Corallococcus sp. AB004]NPC71579.1 acetyltransferase [Corallococcus exiguus]NPD26074.1 acetyltransferase [Corallococcus exiguus]NRD46410.1 acetyltransferase [Corallococcus exiguus]RKH98723.1 acetyltransferase [Corallococcus sp. AB038B]